MRFFIPEWADLVDPAYDFTTETPSEGHRRDRWQHDKRIWEFFPTEHPPIDGVLVSRMVFEKAGPFRYSGTDGRLRSFLRLPRSMELMGDCGAFGYVNSPTPPYGPKDTLDFYRKSGVDIGVTVDHLIVPSIIPRGGTKIRPLTRKEKRERWEISLKNALEMYTLWASDEEYWNHFRLMGAIQGETVEEYQEAARTLVNAGFTYLGIGGLVRSTSAEIRSVLAAVRAATRSRKHGHRVDLHLFGVARQDLLESMKNEGVSSIDSATMLRRAWMSATGNYITADGKRYTALRLPHQLSREDALKRLAVLHEFDAGRTSSRKALEAAIESAGPMHEQSRRASHPVPAFHEEYARTIRDQPWKKCSCPICRQAGIDVLVFRGNDRNRRRGFHNTFVFSHTLRRSAPRVAVVLSCSKTKNRRTRPMPAFLRYSASQTFKAVWNEVSDLHLADIFVLSGKYGLLRWDERIPHYDEQIGGKNLADLGTDLTSRLSAYDRVFFYGAGAYRGVLESLAAAEPERFRLFPSKEHSNGRRLDILELKRQPGHLRRAILAEFPDVSLTPSPITASASWKRAKQATLPL